MCIRDRPWGVAVALPDLNGPWGEFMKKVSVEWHKSGTLLALEKKWGIKQSPFLVEMNKKIKGLSLIHISEPTRPY